MFISAFLKSTHKMARPGNCWPFSRFSIGRKGVSRLLRRGAGVCEAGCRKSELSRLDQRLGWVWCGGADFCLYGGRDSGAQPNVGSVIRATREAPLFAKIFWVNILDPTEANESVSFGLHQHGEGVRTGSGRFLLSLPEGQVCNEQQRFTRKCRHGRCVSRASL